MEDDGIISERGLLRRGSVNAISALVGSIVPFFKNACDVKLAAFKDIYFREETKIHKNLKIFVPQKFLAIQ